MIALVPREYSPVRHLALSIRPNLDARRFQMAMFTVYFDASGNSDNVRNLAAFYVCGFVAPMQKWIDLEAAWPKLLDEYDMPRPFRMAEFMARNQKKPNAFTGWPGDAAREKAFRFAAVNLAHLFTNKPFAIGVVNSDLARLFNEYDVPTDVPRNPYAWCAMRAVDHVIGWVRNRHIAGAFGETADLAIVFEHGDDGQPEFSKALWAKYHLEVAFPTNHGKQSVPFALCDWFAWECRHWMTTRERRWVELKKADSLPDPERSHTEGLRVLTQLMAETAIMKEIARRMPSNALRYTNWDGLTRIAERDGWPRKC